MRIRLTLCAFTALTLAGGLAHAHLQLMTPAPRFTYSDMGIKTSPCGSGTRTNMVTSYAPGQSIMITWRETIGHDGHYRIALSANMADFVAPTSAAVPATNPAWVLMDGIPDRTGTMTYNQMITLPNMECPACVLQVIQVMTNTNNGSTTGTFSGNYFTCADLRITNSDGGVMGTGGRGADAGMSGSGGAGGRVGGRDAGMMGSGGAPGTGGATVNPGTGGATANPGTGGATANPGTGGATTNPGTGGATTNPGTGGAMPAQDAGGGQVYKEFDDPACACTTPAPGPQLGGAIAFAALMLLRRRRGR